MNNILRHLLNFYCAFFMVLQRFNGLHIGQYIYDPFIGPFIKTNKTMAMDPDEAQRRREECERKARRGEMDPRLEFTFQLLIDATQLPRHQLMDYIFEGDMVAHFKLALMATNHIDYFYKFAAR